jgi:hypothetical protein
MLEQKSWVATHEKRAEPGATANGRSRPWLISNVRQKNETNSDTRIYLRALGASVRRKVCDAPRDQAHRASRARIRHHERHGGRLACLAGERMRFDCRGGRSRRSEKKRRKKSLVVLRTCRTVSADWHGADPCDRSGSSAHRRRVRIFSHAARHFQCSALDSRSRVWAAIPRFSSKERAEPIARANGPKRPWLISNDRRKKPLL